MTSYLVVVKIGNISHCNALWHSLLNVAFDSQVIFCILLVCRNLTELDIQENGIEDKSGSWLSCFPESFTSLEVLNFANLHSDVNLDALERLVSRCKSLKTLKVSKGINLEQLQRLVVRAPHLVELGTGLFSLELTAHQYSELESAFNNCKNLHTLSGLWAATAQYLPVLYPACTSLTFLNLSYSTLDSDDLAKLLVHCPTLRRLWVCNLICPLSHMVSVSTELSEDRNQHTILFLCH